MENYLQHHGIIGQRWGKKHGPPYPLDGDESKLVSNKGSSSPGYKTKNPKMENRKESSYERYKKQLIESGHSEEEAEKMANGRKHAFIALGVVGGVILAAGAGLAIYNYVDSHKDSTIEAGKAMQTVYQPDQSIDERINSGRRFFMSFTEKDNLLYDSPIFSHRKQDSLVSTFVSESGIKVASEASSRKVFNDLLKNDTEFRDNVVESIKQMGGSKARPESVSGYRLFNKSLVLGNDLTNKVEDKFYAALKNKGYGGIIDVNDSKLEGWTYKPTILFDNSVKHVISTTRVSDLSMGEEARRSALGLRYYLQRQHLAHPETIRKDIRNVGLAFMGNVLAVKGKYSLDNINKAAGIYADDYLKKHPNSNKSKEDLIKEYNIKYQ